MIKNINNNKIIMITHIADIDGMGSLILAKKHYSNIDYILCEINELIEVFSSIDYSKYELIESIPGENPDLTFKVYKRCI